MTKKIRDIQAIFGSFRAKVTLVLIGSLFLMLFLSDLLIYRFNTDSEFNLLRERLMAVVQTAALMVDADMLMKIPLNRSGMYGPEYKAIAEKLRRIKTVNPIIKYIYTMAKTEQSGILQFIVDPNPLVAKNARHGGPTAFPGDRYDALRFPEMAKGFLGPAADKQMVADEWGVTLSAYTPIRDAGGAAVAILGIDMAADDVYILQKKVFWRSLLVLILGFILSVVMGLFLSKGLTDRIKKLVEGTRRIAQDDLAFEVEVDGHDEISELASSFNKMAISLAASKNKLQDYFFRVVQSLVRILEAKDQYTRGHSERVAEYTGLIAKAMGFSVEKSELLQKAAQMHDIGKLAIHGEILNKKGKLSDEEWKVIKEHPILGEEVLKPVFLDEDMLAMVRSHHERYDGLGYPDKIKGDSINIFAQIISVADAYDAMTSQRAYRQPLSREEALAELEKNCGSQFNTQVVNAFLKALR